MTNKPQKIEGGKLTTKRMEEILSDMPIMCSHDGINLDTRCKKCNTTPIQETWQEIAELIQMGVGLEDEETTVVLNILNEFAKPLLQRKERETIEGLKIGHLRQWINEMPKSSTRLVSNTDIKIMLGLITNH